MKNISFSVTMPVKVQVNCPAGISREAVKKIFLDFYHAYPENADNFDRDLNRIIDKEIKAAEKGLIKK
jgi:hypothetical protein